MDIFALPPLATVTHLPQGGGVRIAAPGNVAMIHEHLITPLREALAEINEHRSLPTKDEWVEPLPHGLAIVLCSDGEVVVCCNGSWVPLGIEDIGFVVGEL